MEHPFVAGFSALVREPLPDFLDEAVQQTRSGTAGFRAETILKNASRQYYAFYFEGNIWCAERGYRTKNELRRYAADGQQIGSWPLEPSGESLPSSVAPRLTSRETDTTSQTGGFVGPDFPGRQLGRRNSAALAMDFSTGQCLVAYWPPSGRTQGQWDFARAGPHTIRLAWTGTGQGPPQGTLACGDQPVVVRLRELWHQTYEDAPQEKAGRNPLREPVQWPCLQFVAKGSNWVGKHVEGAVRHTFLFRPDTGVLEWDLLTGPALWEPVRARPLWSLEGLPLDLLPAELGKPVDWDEADLEGHPGLRLVWVQCVPPKVWLSFWIEDTPLRCQEIFEDYVVTSESRDTKTRSRRSDLLWVSDAGSFGKWTLGSPRVLQDGRLVWKAEFDQHSGGGFSGVRMSTQMDLEVDPRSLTARWTLQYRVDVP